MRAERYLKKEIVRTLEQRGSEARLQGRREGDSEHVELILLELTNLRKDTFGSYYYARVYMCVCVCYKRTIPEGRAACSDNNCMRSHGPLVLNKAEVCIRRSFVHTCNIYIQVITVQTANIPEPTRFAKRCGIGGNSGLTGGIGLSG